MHDHADKTLSSSAPKKAAGESAAAGRANIQLKGVGYAAGVQMLSSRGGDASAVHEAAQHGMSSGGGSIPHMDRLQQSFGAHDISNVQAHVGGAATAACSSMGAEAYASGQSVAFKGSPDLHTAAHEAAHVVQQRSGVSLSDGVGKSGDTYEHHADAVADAVVAGRSAEPILDKMGSRSATGGAVQAKSVQMYSKVSGQPYDRVSDDGKLAVGDHTRNAWAEKSTIASSNAILKAQKAKATIEEVGSSISVAAPGSTGGTPNKLHQFRMVTAPGVEASLVDDCGSANQQMLGAEAAGYWSFVAANKWGDTQEFTKKSRYKGDDNARGGVTSTTENLSGEIYQRIFQREYNKTYTRTEALDAWSKLGAADQKKMSQKYGINEYAVPEVGQGVTIGSERDMPGATGGGYNFHFGLNLMASGHDYVTLEDYDSSGVKYYFDMYGPASKKQAWAQDPGNTGALGNKTTTMVVTHPETLKGETTTDGVKLLEAFKFTELGALKRGTKVQITQQGNGWLLVNVLDGPLAGKSGWIPKADYKDT